MEKQTTMDPVSILALTNTCLSLTLRLATLSNQLHSLADRYQQAQHTISLFDVQLAALAAAARVLHKWLGRPAAQHSQLQGELKQSLDACDTLVMLIMEQLAEWQAKSNKMTFWTKAKYLWDEATVMRYENMLRGQVQALSLLLQVMELPSQAEQDAFIKSDRCSVILTRARDDSSSLLWLRDAESTRTYTSVLTDNLETMDVKFDFDELIITSKVYRSTLASFLRQGILRDNKGKANSIRSGTQKLLSGNSRAGGVSGPAARPSSGGTLMQTEPAGPSSQTIKMDTDPSKQPDSTPTVEARLEQSLQTILIDNQTRIDTAQAVIATLFPKHQDRKELSAPTSNDTPERLLVHTELTDKAGPEVDASNLDSEPPNETSPISDDNSKDEMGDLVSLVSSSPDIPDGDIDFEYVYVLHTFNATVKGQVTAEKGAQLVLLDDTNSYWWLVRVVPDGDIDGGALGYMPAELIETPAERLARLNKHRNLDQSSSYAVPAKGGIASVGTRMKMAGSALKDEKKVRFAINTVFIGTSSYVDELQDQDHDHDETSG